MILGITGGSGCGKSTLLAEIQALGGLALDCDAIYHQLLREDTALVQAIGAAFPGVVDGGVVDRKKLGNVVFSDEKALSELNKITHTAVNAEVLRRLEGHSGLAAIDAYGLFEGGLAELCDVTVAVTAPEECRVRRLMVRDGISEEYAHRRLAAQHDDGWFREKCGYVLKNDADSSAFHGKCLAFFRELGIMDTEL